jgi:hypothetical protein
VKLDGMNRTTRTNQNGVWAFSLITSGTYSVTATYTGSGSVTVTAVQKQP